MTYSETIDYLFNVAPLFQQVGGAAYKEGLSNTHLLDSHFGHPHRKFRTIHVGGTNGKGSCAHTLAAVLQSAGYRTGLYTSPHLVDFRERIRVNGEMMPEEEVVKFVDEERTFFEPLHPSFFELTTALAFKYFAEQEVDVAVVEVGLGGRLDCTNIIHPVLSVITNISFDHTQFLGDTLAKIASEKAGIIKAGVPVVIGESAPETRTVFEEKAREAGAQIYFAEEAGLLLEAGKTETGRMHYVTKHYGEVEGELLGDCQIKNAATILCSLAHLPDFEIGSEDVKAGFANVCKLTGLRGRWETLQESPKVVCDTGHNPGGWQYLSRRLGEIAREVPQLHIVFGMAGDKDIDAVMSALPRSACYYFTQASVHRAMRADEVERHAFRFSLKGNRFETVSAAYQAALQAASARDFVYVGGSCFVVADLLAYLK